MKRGAANLLAFSLAAKAAGKSLPEYLGLRPDIVCLDIDLAGTLMREDYENRREEMRLEAMVSAGTLRAMGGGGSPEPSFMSDEVRR